MCKKKENNVWTGWQEITASYLKGNIPFNTSTYNYSSDGKQRIYLRDNEARIFKFMEPQQQHHLLYWESMNWNAYFTNKTFVNFIQFQIQELIIQVSMVIHQILQW